MIGNETDSSQMQLLRIHVHLELQLRLKSNFRDFEYSNSALLGQVSIMCTLHLFFFLISCQLILFVTIQVVLNALGHYLFDISFALGWISNGLFGHHSQIVGHGDASLGRRHQTKRHFLLSISFFLKTLLLAQLFLFLLSKEEGDNNSLVLLDLLVFERYGMLYVVRDPI